MTAPARPHTVGRIGWSAIATGGFVLAFLARLVPMLRGGGLAGYGPYDDSVYYASAVGLVHGVLPYRDFLLLQPPGITVLLAPFAALGRLIGESHGFAVARLGWMVMGGVTTVLIIILLRRLGRVAAGLGGAFYALFWPAALVERVTDQEAPQNLLLVLAAVLLLGPEVPGPERSAERGHSALRTVVAGAVLGLALGIKIWAVVPLAVWAIWLLRRRGIRHTAVLVASAAVVAAVVYLPFFGPAPGRMWRMVVADQLGRRRMAGWTERLAFITGTTAAPGPRTVVVALAILGFAVAVVLAWRLRWLRPVVVIHLLMVVVLLVAPPTFVHYGALLGPSAAVIIGAAVGGLVRGAGPATGRPRVRPIPTVAVLVLAVVLVAMAAAQAGHRYGERLDVARIGPVVRRSPGCITYDSPSPALALSLVGRNIDRGCPLVVDLGGVSYERGLRVNRPRARNASWQRYALRYLGSGRLVLISRFRAGFGFSAESAQTVRSWPLVARDGLLRIRRPDHETGRPTS